MNIDVHSDVVCPWCYVGKRRLEAALAARPTLIPRVSWQPYELNPGVGTQGVDRSAHLEAKFGNDALVAMQARLVAVGREVGIGFRFDRIARTPNTRAAHQMIQFAQGANAQSRVVERLFKAYFEDGLDVGDRAVLVQLAHECNLDVPALMELLESMRGCDEIAAREEAALAMGITGVPAFVFDRRYLVSGAQSVPLLLEVIDRVSADSRGRDTET
jgi:predicted DsbA family dithiol-disulfide isomerase